jgi:recombinational DNA repair ATPase RecF
MIIKKITISNFQVFAGKRTVELSTDKIKPFTTIIGLGATGKTTLCDAVTWCLFEEIEKRKLKTIKHKDASEKDSVYVEIEAQVKRSVYIIKRSLLGSYTDLYITKNSRYVRDTENELKTIAPIFLNEAVVINSENLDENVFYESQPPARRNFIFDLLFDSSAKISLHTMVLNKFFEHILNIENKISIDSQARTINIVGSNGKQDLRTTLGSGSVRVINIYLIMALHTLIHKEAPFPIFLDSIFSLLSEDQKKALISLFTISNAQIIFLEFPMFLESDLFQQVVNKKSHKNSLLSFSLNNKDIEIFSL